MTKPDNAASGGCLDSGSSAEAKARWNPYLVGAGIGVLSWVAFGVLNQPIGISTAMSSAASVCALPFVGSEGIAHNAYWAKTPFKWDGGMLFLVGTFLGAVLSVVSSGTFRVERVPATWSEHFGASTGKRLLAAFFGGVIIMFGARMAGGCTSGHGISGSLQLAVSSWLFFLTLFASGIVTSMVLFRKRPTKAG